MFTEKARKESRLGKICRRVCTLYHSTCSFFYNARFGIMNDWGVMLLSWNNGRFRLIKKTQQKRLILQSFIALAIKKCFVMVILVYALISYYAFKYLSIASFKNAILFGFTFLLNRLMHNKQCVVHAKRCYLMCIMKRNEWALRRQWVT